MKFLALVCLVALPVLAQFSADDQMRFCSYTNETGEVFDYRVSVPQFPAPGQRYPMIVFLHGSGECGTDNKKQIKIGLPALLKSLMMLNQQAVILAPQCQQGNWWVHKLAREADYKAAKKPTAAMEITMMHCRNILETQSVDPDRVYITGLSLGGFGAWDAIQRWPDFFAAAVPICGGGDVHQARQLKKMPVWAFHGDADKSVSVDCSRRMVEAIRKAGGRRYRYTEFSGVAHNSWDRAYADQEMVTWLLNQRRNAKKPFWKFW
ncbi:MAG: PHB depolymerase family esterase [Kiritimatiellia bacterium]